MNGVSWHFINDMDHWTMDPFVQTEKNRSSSDKPKHINPPKLQSIK